MIIIALYVLFVVYIKISHPFWSKQPVHHLYQLNYLLKKGVIQKNLPKINKYCDNIHVHSKNYSDLSLEDKKQIGCLIQKNYLQDKDVKYIPTLKTIFSYFEGHTIRCIISCYYEKEPQIKKQDVTYVNKIYGVITGRPIHFLNCKDKNEFKMYYIDFLCVDKQHRKKQIAPKLIQTHEYNARRMNESIQVSFFKRETSLTLIKSFTYFDCYMFLNQFPIIRLHEKYKYIKITKKNFHIYIDFIRNQCRDSFDYFVSMDESSILKLISTNQLLLYGVFEKCNMHHIYLFKNSDYYYNDALALECIGSWNGNNSLLFKQHFFNILHKLNCSYIYIENVANNDILISSLQETQSYIFKTVSAYYFYNYIHKQVSSNKSFIVI